MNFKELAEKRFSARKYTDEPVSKADIDYIMECTRLAPSAHNLQPWKFFASHLGRGEAEDKAML